MASLHSLTTGRGRRKGLKEPTAPGTFARKEHYDTPVSSDFHLAEEEGGGEGGGKMGPISISLEGGATPSDPDSKRRGGKKVKYTHLTFVQKGCRSSSICLK